MKESRVFRTIKRIVIDFSQDLKCYSLALAAFRTGETAFQSLRLKKLSRLFQTKKNDYVLQYLERRYGYVFKKNRNKDFDAERVEDTSKLPIWVCWLNGIEQAPLLVRKCVSSIKENAGTHPVHIVTWDNYKEFVTIPKYILEKVENGMMGAAHFSDILRVCLLAEHGGLWLDATIYCRKRIPEEYFNGVFFTCKSESSNIGCISKNRWTTFCLGGIKGCIVFCVLRDFFFRYWKEENQAIDYLFFDDAIEIARERIPEVNFLIENVPYNNADRDKLILRFSDPWKEGCLDDLFKGNTVLFKLGYREKIFLNELTRNGEPTVYAAFLKDFRTGGDL